MYESVVAPAAPLHRKTINESLEKLYEALQVSVGVLTVSD
jgi:hypothetical protein